MNTNPYFTQELEEEDEYFDKVTWYEPLVMLATVTFFIVLFKISDFVVWLKPKGHFKELLICFVLALIVSAFVIVSLLYWARYAFA